MWLIALVALLGGALQLWAAVSAHRRVGPLRSPQGRALEAAFGRAGTVRFFAILGVGLLLVAVWFVRLALQTG